MIKRTAFLAMIAISPCLMQAMDESEYKIPQAIVTHRKEAMQLCNASYFMLQNFKAHEKNSLSKLVKVVDQMQNLKLACPPVLEREIGFHIYYTNPKLDFMDSLKSPFSPVANNIKASVFFAHLQQYHADLSQKGFVSPNKTTVFNYLKQQKIDAIVTKNAQRGLIIPEQTVKEMTIPAQGSIGIIQFAALAHTIEDFLRDSPEEMHHTIELFYHNELTGQQSSSS
jgi:hypothetical protein